MPKRAATPFLIAVIVGALLWVLAAVLSGRREPWDSPYYWSIAYPAAIFVAGCIGFFFPHGSWRWAFALFGAQFVAMCILNGEVGNLWPLGLALFALLATPAALAATLASRLGKRSRPGGVS
jgi:peptidoglycan/LPS O-acetylase OafA/YrhL